MRGRWGEKQTISKRYRERDTEREREWKSRLFASCVRSVSDGAGSPASFSATSQQSLVEETGLQGC